MIKISPSILAADFGKLNEEIKSIEDYCDTIHIDVMDGHFVDNITFGPDVVEAIKTRKPLDIHLMVSNPDKYAKAFANAGADRLIFHYEASKNITNTLDLINSLDVGSGIAIKPATQASRLDKYIDKITMALVMTVEPGFGGQEFMEKQLEKVKYLRNLDESIAIGVDGGVDKYTAGKCVAAGANVLVAGSSVFREADRKNAIETLIKTVT